MVTKRAKLMRACIVLLLSVGLYRTVAAQELKLEGGYSGAEDVNGPVFQITNPDHALKFSHVDPNNRPVEDGGLRQGDNRSFKIWGSGQPSPSQGIKYGPVKSTKSGPSQGGSSSKNWGIGQSSSGQPAGSPVKTTALLQGGQGERCAILGRYEDYDLAGGPSETLDYINVGILGGVGYGVAGIADSGKAVGILARNTGGYAGVFEGDILLRALSNDPGDIIFQTSDGTQKARIWSEPSGVSGLHLSSGDNDPDLSINPDGTVLIKEKLKIVSRKSGQDLIEFGDGLDYAEGFDVSDDANVGPGTVLVIDPQNPGNLTVSTDAYDTKVAGIIAGAKALGSGVRLGTGQFDKDVALAGRVYCNVDATEGPVEPGDLLTTSATAGYAMKVSDHLRAQGAILGKAMERLEKGRRAQILVLVTLQ